jgi:hypothetical protein
LFSIIAWKSNRSKSKLARRLVKKSGTLELAAMQFTSALFKAGSAEARLRVAIKDWGLGRIVGAIALLYFLALLGSWFTNKAQFWKLAAYGLLTGVGVVGALLGWRQIQAKLRLRKLRKLRASIQQSAVEAV